jgi:hypothetical protein
MIESELKSINEQIGVAEEQGDGKFLSEKLSDRLIFKRADESIATKAEFLAKVPDNKYPRRSRDITIILNRQNDLALVTLVIEAKGDEIRNLRVFERNENGWQCIVWFNTKIS